VAHYLRLHVPEDQAREKALEAEGAFEGQVTKLRQQQPKWPEERVRRMAVAQLARAL
jgi:hypothetical protein